MSDPETAEQLPSTPLDGETTDPGIPATTPLQHPAPPTRPYRSVFLRRAYGEMAVLTLVVAVVAFLGGVFYEQQAVRKTHIAIAEEPGRMVQEGDTLTSIAVRWGTSVDAIAEANPKVTKKNEDWCKKHRPHPSDEEVMCNPHIGLDGKILADGAPPVPGLHRLMVGDYLVNPNVAPAPASP